MNAAYVLTRGPYNQWILVGTFGSWYLTGPSRVRPGTWLAVGLSRNQELIAPTRRALLTLILRGGHVA